jgi:hypothetical protein
VSVAVAVDELPTILNGRQAGGAIAKALVKSASVPVAYADAKAQTGEALRSSALLRLDKESGADTLVSAFFKDQQILKVGHLALPVNGSVRFGQPVKDDPAQGMAALPRHKEVAFSASLQLKSSLWLPRALVEILSQ